MIFGNNRPQVFKNIKKAVKAKQFNIPVELDDPVLTLRESKETVEKYWQHTKTFSYKLTNAMIDVLYGALSNLSMSKSQIVGQENIKNIGPAIVTTNHFKHTDSLPIKKLALLHHKQLYIVIEDINLLLPGLFGVIMNNENMVPISKSPSYLGREFPQHIKDVFKKDAWLLVYPEQEMWYEYRKPRPLKNGAYYYAAKNKVPIISCFVEIQNLPKPEKKAPHFNKTKIILHILSPIYPDPHLSIRANAKKMCEIDYNQKKAAYEKAYGKKLDYTFDNSDIAGYDGPID